MDHFMRIQIPFSMGVEERICTGAEEIPSVSSGARVI